MIAIVRPLFDDHDNHYSGIFENIMPETADYNAIQLQIELQNFSNAVNNIEKDPSSLEKISELFSSTEKVYHSTRPHSGAYFMKKYYESKGLQKLVDLGLNFAEQITAKRSTEVNDEANDKVKDLEQQGTRILAALKKYALTQMTPEAPEVTESPQTQINSSNIIASPLQILFSTYKNLNQEEYKIKKQNKTQETENFEFILKTLQEIYKASKTLQAIVYIGLEFTEKILEITVEDTSAIQNYFKMIYKNLERMTPKVTEKLEKMGSDPKTNPIRVKLGQTTPLGQTTSLRQTKLS